MNVRYANQQDKHDPMNGKVLRGRDELAEVLDARRRRVPFIAKLYADNGYQLTFGIGSGVGWAQHSRMDGEPPYLLAVPAQQRVKSRHVYFLMNNTPTPVSGRYILNFDEVKEIALHFLVTGERSAAFPWESI